MRVDLACRPEALTEAVEVQANAIALDSETATVGQVITEKQITDLPLNGRNFLSLLFLGAGAVETDGEQGTMRQGAGNAISIMGSRPTSNNFMIDGTANIDTALGTPAAILSVDAIEEFKEQTKTYSAEYGFSANQINIVSKSGTNEFHGSALLVRAERRARRQELLRPCRTPRSPSSTRSSSAAAVRAARSSRTRRSCWSNYEGTRIDRGFSTLLHRPDPDQLAGRFSLDDHRPLDRPALPEQHHPTSRFSRLAQRGAAEQVVPRSEYELSLRATSVRADAPPDSEPVHAYGSTRTWAGRTGLRPLHGDGVREHIHGTVSRTSETSSSSRTPRTGRSPTRSPSGATSSTCFGSAASWPGEPAGNMVSPGGSVDALRLTGDLHGHPRRAARMPGVAIDWGYAGAGGPGQRIHRQQPTHVGHQQHHHLGQGKPYARRSVPTTAGGSCSETRLPTSPATSTSQRLHEQRPVADFLLGYYAGATAFQPAAFPRSGAAGNPREFNLMYFAPYIQDDWKVSPKLTLNLGLRYDYRNVPYETNNHMAWRNLDYAPGGLFVADESLAAGHRRRRLLPVRRASEPGESRSIQGLRSSPRIRLPSDRVRKDGRPRRLRNLLRLSRGARNRRCRGHLSLRQPEELSPRASRQTPYLHHRPVVPELRGSPSGPARCQHLPRRQPVSGAEEPNGPSVVARRAALLTQKTSWS